MTNPFRTFLPLISFLILSLSIILFSGHRWAGDGAEGESRKSEPGVYSGYSSPLYKGFSYSSTYISTHDSTMLALDLYLPKKLDEKEQIPTILYLTRYVRSFEAKWPLSLFARPVFGQIEKEEIAFFTSYGYACVVVDVRGTGASFGTRSMEFSPEEILDGRSVVDWIIDQDWSDGRVGSTGISYLGTTAEMLLTNAHPAVKACIPRSNIFDLYNDIVFPGGMPHTEFVEVWKNTTYALDNNELDYISKQAGRLLKGPSRTDEDRKGEMLKQAQEEHRANFDIFKGMLDICCRDEKHPLLGKSLDDFSIHTYRNQITASQTPVYRISGWYDGALARSAIHAYLNIPNTVKLLLGPWDHGPDQHISPFRDNNKMAFDIYTEMLRFFDHYLKGIENGIDQEDPVYYYNMGKEEWMSSPSWPPPAFQNDTLYLLSDRSLALRNTQSAAEAVHYSPEYRCGTGGGSRWNSLTTKYRYEDEIGYPDRSQENEKMLTFTGPVFENEVNLTGTPVADLYLSADATDGSIFVYIEDVGPDGEVTYVTEGQLRLIHRKWHSGEACYQSTGLNRTFFTTDTSAVIPGQIMQIKIDFIPISYLFKKGHRLQLSICGSDIDHFQLLETKPENIAVYMGPGHPSALYLPLAFEY